MNFSEGREIKLTYSKKIIHKNVKDTCLYFSKSLTAHILKYIYIFTLYF